MFKKINPALNVWSTGTSHPHHIKDKHYDLIYLFLRQTVKYQLTSVCVEAAFQGAVSIRKTVLPGMAIPMLKIRRPNGRLIFNMEIAIRR